MESSIDKIPKKLKNDINAYKAEVTRITQELNVRDKIVQDMLIDKDRSHYYDSGNNSLIYGSPMPKNKEVLFYNLVDIGC